MLRTVPKVWTPNQARFTRALRQGLDKLDPAGLDRLDPAAQDKPFDRLRRSLRDVLRKVSR